MNWCLPGDVLKHIDERVADALSPLVSRAVGYARRGQPLSSNVYKVTHTFHFEGVRAVITVEAFWDEPDDRPLEHK